MSVKPKAAHLYSHEEATARSTVYFKGDTLAANVWVSKYALKDSDGNLYEVTPDDMHWRIANEVHRIEKRYPNPLSAFEVYELLKDFKYIIPQGSPMAGIGNDIQVGSLSNCFVIGNEPAADSYGGIMRTDQEQVQLMKRRGGVGHDLSHIRPKGSPVKNTALTSTGIVPFMERFSNSTREVAQDGRRGALMLSISVKHPDAGDFIDAKLETGKVTGANISVKITDDFMQAVINNTEFVQQYPVDSPNPKFTKKINARDLWDKIIHNAWKSAEPGVLFWDTVIRESVPDSYADSGFRTVSTNPCGEIPLCPYDSCRLLAINLFNYVDKPFTPEASFNMPLFKEHVNKAQRMMDDLIDLELEKIDVIVKKINDDPEDPETKRIEYSLWQNIKRKAVEGRRTGFGITAEGDMLAALGLRYGSDEAIDFSVGIHKTLAIEAYRSSVQLARERGSFSIYDAEKEINNPFINRIRQADPELYHNMIRFGRRNVALLTIAPTGSVSILTQTTSGIEPVFMINYKRRRKVNPNDKNVVISFTDEVGDTWEEYNVFHPQFLNYLTINGYDLDAVIKYSDEQLNPIIEASPYFKATANDVDWVAKVHMQGAVQKWVDHSISVTVNVPTETKQELIGEIYKTAWESGCKGMTVYRDGSRSGVLVSADKKDEKPIIRETNAPPRPKVLEAEVVRFQNDYEKWVAVVGIYEGRPYEIFTGKEEGFYAPRWVTRGWVIKSRTEDGISRYDFQFADKEGYKTTMEGLSRMFEIEYWNYAKLISGILRHGMPLPNVVELVSKLSFTSDSINTWKAGVERALKKFIPDGTKPSKAHCPSCDHPDGLVYQEGCLTCKNCGYSKCG
ncbi:MAG TPA: adenosylcobalamin-dependent ribonucleoside-diphosphate reductase [Bacteroidales bacterium]|nr:MAG: ribonucleoside-diphosphate reductase, adenosylcobalamin-dependent [Bacteroidetes bacterium GWE2_42_24]OFY25996.1 MAG: ribonucleoside-diphosphate reductase, adenosylcobalamin-dependent [Bacteroidetes bacterium GWF2_43_11]HBZ66614.1 adenosylcobalamin-dependent ribonucleoside-diphosphate reductase [Bacteroidales bacterium]